MKRPDKKKADGGAAAHSTSGSSILRRMNVADVFSGESADADAFEEFLKPQDDCGARAPHRTGTDITVK